MAIVSKIISSNKPEETPQEKNKHKKKKHSSRSQSEIRDPEDILTCLLVLNKFSKLVGTVIGLTLFVISIIALTV